MFQRYYLIRLWIFCFVEQNRHKTTDRKASTKNYNQLPHCTMHNTYTKYTVS